MFLRSPQHLGKFTLRFYSKNQNFWENSKKTCDHNLLHKSNGFMVLKLFQKSSVEEGEGEFYVLKKSYKKA